mgnify:FL=1
MAYLFDGYGVHDTLLKVLEDVFRRSWTKGAKVFEGMDGEAACDEKNAFRAETGEGSAECPFALGCEG